MELCTAEEFAGAAPGTFVTIEPPSVWPPGQRGVLGEGLRGGGPGRPPFWRTPKSPVRQRVP
jgi:hypothetical protein